ncbi:hypothetical protein T03_8304 [Trichinella britovi]|uniref:Uncharacterized protein n=1 Tax=Trichinella britovi TaxID=45882 RepID=A0A0V1DI44_TRIBR|nr:hypothetical protein T03_8304 [Trichinella britovi]
MLFRDLHRRENSFALAPYTIRLELKPQERCCQSSQLSSKDRLATAAKPCSTVEACSLVSQRQAVEASQSARQEAEIENCITAQLLQHLNSNHFASGHSHSIFSA